LSAFFFGFSGSGSQHTYFMCVFLFNFERTMTPPELIRLGVVSETETVL